MAFNKHQFRDLITRVLREINLYSESAVNLLLGTAAQESRFGTYLKQFGSGPARGVFQMERMTFDDLQGRYGKTFPVIKQFRFEQLEWDLKAAIIMARIKYWSIPTPLPDSNDLGGLGAYWKQWYNTPLGAGTAQDFANNYANYVLA